MLTDAKEAKQKELDAIQRRLYNYINTYGGLLEKLEEKVHFILNRKNPSKQLEPINEEKAPDKLTEINAECDRLNAFNNILQRILDHVSEII